MRKLISVLLSVLLILSVVPMMSFAAVENDDLVIASLKNEDNYYHLQYVEEKDGFKTERAAYTALSLYEDAWQNYFTKSTDTDYAKTILLALIDRFEAEYNNETYEQVIAVLKGAKDIADFVNKVDSYTHILDLAENSTWATSLSVLDNAVKVMNYGNEVYEEYVEAYAIIISCQAAGQYYGDFLDYIAATVDNEAVVAAAEELKANIEQSTEDAINALLARIAEDAAADAATMGVGLAMDAYSVTAIIKTVYNTVGNLADKLFSTQDKYQYMSSLAIIYDIESVLPDYVDGALAADDIYGQEFAINALLTIRETGEGMLLNLGQVIEDSIAAKLFKGYDKTEIKNRTAANVAKLAVLREIIKADKDYNVKEIITLVGPTDVSFSNTTFPTLLDGEEAMNLTDDGAFASVYVKQIKRYVKVAAIATDAASAMNIDASVGGILNIVFENAEGTKYAANKYISSTRAARIDSVAAPAYTIVDGKDGDVAMTMFDTYEAAAAETTYADAPAASTQNPSSGSSSTKTSSFANFFKNLFASISNFFKNLFKK